MPIKIMNDSKEYRPVSCLNTFGLLLALLTAFSAKGQTEAENLTIEWHSGRPRLLWQGERQAAYEIWKTPELGETSMGKRVHITHDDAQLLWSDETASGSAAFYQVVRKPENSLSAEFQSRLNRIRGAWGVQAAVIMPGQGMWVGTSGRNTIAPDDKINSELRFSVGSITKTFVAALIMQLVEEDTLTLEDTLEQWLPDLVHEEYRPGAVTVRQLLGHRSGIFDMTAHPQFSSDVAQDATRKFTPEETVAYSDRSPYFAPGEGFAYSNTGYNLLGLIAEKATKSSIHEEIRRRFLDPFNLNTTYLEVAEEATGEAAHGYEGGIDQTEISRTSEYSFAWAAGAMVSTAPDIARWMEALYGGKVLSEESVNAMIPEGGYGLGTGRFESSSGGTYFGHNGGIPGYHSYAVYSPESKVSIVLLYNTRVNLGVYLDSFITMLSRLKGSLPL